MQPSEFERVIEALDGMSLSQLQRFVHEAEARRRQAEALAEIEENAGDAPPCPGCGSRTVVRWGYSDSGLQRRRCRACGKTFNAAHGTGLAYTRKRDVLLAFTKQMLMPNPMSCRGQPFGGRQAAKPRSTSASTE